MPDVQQKLVAAKGSIFVLGPAYSGKSEFIPLICPPSLKTVFIGCAQVHDELLKERVDHLAAQRPAHWTTLDAEKEFADQLTALAHDYDQIVVDSFNLWLANAMLKILPKYSPQHVLKHFELEAKRISTLLQSETRIVLVSSEAGAGVTPPQEPARLFRMALGHAHVRFAQASRHVVSLFAGIPRLEKG